jgi:hypothetical protein
MRLAFWSLRLPLRLMYTGFRLSFYSILLIEPPKAILTNYAT